MPCDHRKKKILFYLAEKLMKEAGIEIRDTWAGYEGQNNDDLIANKGHGPRLIAFEVYDDGTTELRTERVELPDFKSLSYENSKIMVSRHLENKAHPLIHEAVHYLQHNTIALDDSYFKVKSKSAYHYKQWVSQRAECEAFFVQLMFIVRYEPISNEVLLRELKKRLQRAMAFPAERVGFICWAHKNKIV